MRISILLCFGISLQLGSSYQIISNRIRSFQSPALVSRLFGLEKITIENGSRMYRHRHETLIKSSDDSSLDVCHSNGANIGIQDVPRHIILLDKSLKDKTGRGVFDRMAIKREAELDDIAAVNKNERFVLISHNTEDNPIYNYGNIACLSTFSRSWEELCQIPSSESVVFKSVDHALREKLMKKVTDEGFVEGASGIRTRGDGRFIQLRGAVVWNCYNEEGVYYGQACLFDSRVTEIIDSY